MSNLGIAGRNGGRQGAWRMARSRLIKGTVAGVVQWQNGSFPSCIRGFDSLRPLQPSRRPDPMAAAYLSASIARRVLTSQDDGAETQSGLRADPGAVPGASTL